MSPVKTSGVARENLINKIKEQCLQLSSSTGFLKLERLIKRSNVPFKPGELLECLKKLEQDGFCTLFSDSRAHNGTKLAEIRVLEKYEHFRSTFYSAESLATKEEVSESPQSEKQRRSQRIKEVLDLAFTSSTEQQISALVQKIDSLHLRGHQAKDFTAEFSKTLAAKKFVELKNVMPQLLQIEKLLQLSIKLGRPLQNFTKLCQNSRFFELLEYTTPKNLAQFQELIDTCVDIADATARKTSASIRL